MIAPRLALGQLGFYYLEELSSIDLKISFPSVPDSSSISRIKHHSVKGDNRKGHEALLIAIDRFQSLSESTTSDESWMDSFGVPVSATSGALAVP
jgi:hypothetical protein